MTGMLVLAVHWEPSWDYGWGPRLLSVWASLYTGGSQEQAAWNKGVGGGDAEHSMKRRDVHHSLDQQTRSSIQVQGRVHRPHLSMGGVSGSLVRRPGIGDVIAAIWKVQSATRPAFAVCALETDGVCASL